MMSQSQMAFIMEYCFREKGDGIYEPKTVELTVTRSVLDTEESGTVGLRRLVTTISLPILTLIPLNSLGVESVDLTFALEITTQASQEDSVQNTLTSKQGKLGSSDEPAIQLHGKIAPTASTPQTEQSTDATKKQDASQSEKSSTNLDVQIKAGQLPLPLGLTTILDLYTKAIQPVTKPPNPQKRS